MRISRRGLVVASTSLSLTYQAHPVAQSSTPAAGLAPAKERIGLLLRFVPEGVLDISLDVLWADVERQFSHLSIDPAEDEDSARELLIQSQFGNLPPLLQTAGRIEQQLGFSELNVLQALTVGIPPGTIQLAALNRAVADLPEIWEAAGYERREGEHGAFWTLGEDGEVSLVHPVQKVAVARLNNIAIVDDQTLVFAPTAELLAQVFAARGETPSAGMTKLAGVSAALPDDAISAWYLDGGLLGVDGPQTGVGWQESDAAVGPMPAIRMLCAGVTAGALREGSGHDPDSRAFLILETAESGQAEQAAPVVEWRTSNLLSQASGTPFRALLPDLDSEIVSGTAVRFTSAEGASSAIFFAIISQRDIAPFAFINEG